MGGVAASTTGAGAAKAELLTPMRWKTAHFVVSKLSRAVYEDPHLNPVIRRPHQRKGKQLSLVRPRPCHP